MNHFNKIPITGFNSGEMLFSFAGAKQGGVTRFFCLTGHSGDVYPGVPPTDYNGFFAGVYSLDLNLGGSNTWVNKTNGFDASYFPMFVGMAENDINTVYLAGGRADVGGNLVLKTSDAGNNWADVFQIQNNQNIKTGWEGYQGDRSWSWGETCFGIAVAPTNSQKVLFGDYGFVHTTMDGGANWQQAYTDPADEHPEGAPTPMGRTYRSIGLEPTTVWQVSWQDAQNMFAGFTDITGIRSTDGGVSWGFDYGGLYANTTYRIVKNTSDNTLFAATSGVHDMYQSTRLADAQLDANDPNGQVLYSTDKGAGWQPLHQFNHPVYWLATSPTDNNTLYASVINYGSNAGGIWVTHDLNNLSSSTWTQLPAPPRTQGHPASIVVLNDGKVVCTYSGRRDASGAFTNSSGVFIYDPASSTWQDVSDPGMYYWTKDIILDTTDHTQSTWYVAVFSGWGGAPNGLGGLYKTTNRGATWTKLTGTQFDRVESITINPSNTKQAYLTTEIQGLWISNNMDQAIPTWNRVDSYPFAHPLRIFFNPFNLQEIWIASVGNGLKLGLDNPSGGVLPVRLTSFSGKRTGNVSTLQWVTATEDPGDKFEVQRSTDGQYFTSIASVAGKGGSQTNQYQYEDRQATANILYYRLKVINIDGSFFYSNVIVLKNDLAITEDNFKIISNPVVNHTIQIQATLRQSATLQLSLIDISGRILYIQNATALQGANQLYLPVPANTLTGLYFIKITSSSRHMATLRCLIRQ